MRLIINSANLGKLLHDLDSYVFGENLNIAWRGEDEQGVNWFAVTLKSSQVKRIYAGLPRTILEERYEAR